MNAPLLEIDALDAFYGATQALFGVTLQVRAGGITALLGANGAGKTTLLRAISGLVRTEGRVSYRGQRIERLPTPAIAALRIAHVPDGRGTFVNLSVEENLRLGGHLLGRAAAVKAEAERVCQYFPRLRERWHQQAGTLSGGEQQMLAIGRALMMRPQLVLLDEPSFGLAPLVVAEIFEIMKKINRSDGVSLFVVEQNARQALALADHAYLLETGRVVLGGDAKALATDARVRDVYLG